MAYNDKNQYSYDKVTNLLSYAVALNPDGAFPLDARVYFGALGDATNPAVGTARYAAKSAKQAGSSDSAYFFGQLLYVVENDKVTTYLIQTNGTLKEVGVTTKGDGSTIVTKTNEAGDTVLSLAGVDEKENKGKILATDGEGNTYWASDSQEELNTDLDVITGRVDKLETTVDGKTIKDEDGKETVIVGLVDKVAALETKLENTGSIFNFAGSFTQDEFNTINKNNYQTGDVVIVDGSKEYVCYEDYVLTTDEAIDNNKIYYIKNADGSYTAASVAEGANPKENGWYIIVKLWEAFGDPSGVEALTKTVNALKDQVDINTGNIKDTADRIQPIYDSIGEEGTKDSETLKYSGHTGLYQHVHEYVVEYAEDQANKVKDYTDTLISGKDGINSQIDSLDGRVETLEDANKNTMATKEELTRGLSGKADSNSVYTKDAVDELIKDFVSTSTTDSLDGRIDTLEKTDVTYGKAITYLQSTVGHAAGKNEIGEDSPGAAANGLVAKVDNNATNIENLQNDLGTNPDTATKKTAFEQITALTNALDTVSGVADDAKELAESNLEAIGTDTKEGSVLGRIKSLETEIRTSDTGIADKVTSLDSTVNDTTNGLVKKVGDNASAIDSLDGRLDSAEAAIENLTGKTTDTKDSISIVGAKKYTDDAKASIIGTSSDDKDDLTLYGIKSYINSTIEDTSDTLSGNIDKNAAAIEVIEGKLDKVTAVMDFRGVVDALPETEDSLAGDVVILKVPGKDADGEGIVVDYEEYVFDGNTWQAIGTVEINNKRLSDLEKAAQDLQKQDETLQDNIDINADDIDSLENRAKDLEDAVDNITNTIGYTINSEATDNTAKTVLELIEIEKGNIQTVSSNLSDAIQDYTNKIDVLDGEIEELLSWGSF